MLTVKEIVENIKKYDRVTVSNCRKKLTKLKGVQLEPLILQFVYLDLFQRCFIIPLGKMLFQLKGFGYFFKMSTDLH